LNKNNNLIKKDTLIENSSMKPMIEESKIEEKNLIIRNEESNTISSKK
jgi:hypothetical protein